MKLVTFEFSGRHAVGAVLAERRIADLTALAVAASMQELIDGGPRSWEKARAAARQASITRSAAAVRLLAPLPVPRRNIFCIGKNYTEHAREFGTSGFDASARGAEELPEFPIVFSKPPSTVIATGEPIPAHLDPTSSVDYEGEIAVVIGRGGRAIARTEAMAHVFGYTLVNDVTARELQKRHKQWLLGKGIDGFCPMGPAIVTADEVADLRRLNIETRVNGELRQQALLSQLIFDVPALIECISATTTLQPGDLIATGTPAGVGIGFKPPKFLARGDRVSVFSDAIGTLENPVA